MQFNEFLSKTKFITSVLDLISYPMLYLGINRNHLNTSASKYCFIQSWSERSGIRPSSPSYNQRSDSMWGTIIITRGRWLHFINYGKSKTLYYLFLLITFSLIYSGLHSQKQNDVHQKISITYHPYQSFYMVYYASPFISCDKCLNAFPLVTFSSMFATLCCCITFLSTYSKILIIYIPYSLSVEFFPKIKSSNHTCWVTTSHPWDQQSIHSSGSCWQRYTSTKHSYSLQIKQYFPSYIGFPIFKPFFNILYQSTDVDKQPSDNLSEVAARDIDSLLSKTSEISKSVIYNIHQSLLNNGGLNPLVFCPKTPSCNY